MEISLEQIKLLREKSGAGMVDCKKALDEAGCDMDKAIDILRKKGITKAAKRAGRETSQGIIKIAISADNKKGFILEVNAETDFVAHNAQFQDFAGKLMNLIIAKEPLNKDIFLGLPMDSGTVLENLNNLSGVIGEKLDIKKYDIVNTNGTVAGYTHSGVIGEKFDTKTVAGYTHMAGRIGVLVSLDQPDKKELAYEIALQVAAVNPAYIEPKEIPEADLDKEKEIYREQLIKEGKPENIIDKIIDGRINKYFEEVCLVKQE
jgi:elongation factor Ts